MIKKLILSIFLIAFFTVSSFSQNRTLPSVKVKNLKGKPPVVQEIQTGYMMKDSLLRPSIVGVAKKIEEKKEKK